MAAKLQLTGELIRKAVEERRPASMSGLYRALGGKSNPAGSTIKAIRELVPEIGELLKARSTAADSPREPEAQGARPAKKAKARKGKAAFPPHPANPYRPTSNYAVCFNALAAFPDGLTRQRLQELYAKATRKSQEKARFDVAVVISPKGESPTCERHRSAREGYGVRKGDGGFVQLVLP